MTPAALAPSLAAHFKNRPARQLTPFLQCERAAVLSEQDSMKTCLAGFLWFAVESTAAVISVALLLSSHLALDRKS